MTTFIACLWCLSAIFVSFRYGSHEKQMEARAPITTPIVRNTLESITNSV